MASIAPARDSVSAERRFFLIMAIVFAATVVIGFTISGLFLIKVSPLEMPIQIHIHAVTFMTWTGFYVLQNALVDRGSIAIHRQLGWVGAGLAAWMVLLGWTVTILCLRRHAVPFFFPPAVFLLIDGLAVTVFAGLLAAAVRMRNRPDWHKRLMLCAMALVITPALGRILPMPLLGFWAPVGVAVAAMLYIVAGMVYDQRARGSIHPAYWWGIAAHAATVLAVMIGGYSAPVTALAAWIAGA